MARPPPTDLVFATTRLRVRRARDDEDDVLHFLALWNDPRVMRLVGFPRGLGITAERVRDGIRANPAGPYDQKLVVERRADGVPVGEAKLGTPDADGTSETDVKLLPEHWGHGYGTEIKQGLVDHLFAHTACRRVRATPNKANTASHRMQEAVGARRVGEGLFVPPDGERHRMCEVPHWVYEVTRETWLRRRAT